MENKKYLDKVLDHLVRGTRLDYEKKKVYSPSSLPILFVSFFSFPYPFFSPSFFSTYCRNQFGLTDKEIKYVWREYKSIIKDKIKNGE